MRLLSYGPEPYASANSATPACWDILQHPAENANRSLAKVCVYGATRNINGTAADPQRNQTGGTQLALQKQPIATYAHPPRLQPNPIR